MCNLETPTQKKELLVCSYCDRKFRQTFWKKISYDERYYCSYKCWAQTIPSFLFFLSGVAIAMIGVGAIDFSYEYPKLPLLFFGFVLIGFGCLINAGLFFYCAYHSSVAGRRRRLIRELENVPRPLDSDGV